MGWVWRDEEGDGVFDSRRGGIADYENHSSNLGSDERCSTRKVVKSQCRTEETEPGKFVRKCEKTEELLRHCVGKPVEVVQSNKEYTEEDVTEQALRDSFSMGSQERGVFDLPGLQSDIHAIGRSLFSGMDRFFDAAEEMKKEFFSMLDNPPLRDRPASYFPSMRRGIPIEERPPREFSPQADKDDSGVDLSGLSKDV